MDFQEIHRKSGKAVIADFGRSDRSIEAGHDFLKNFPRQFLVVYGTREDKPAHHRRKRSDRICPGAAFEA
jgi:hypothetical protein